MRKILLIIFLFALPASRADVAVTNLTATQRQGTKLVDINYDLISDTVDSVPIRLEITDGGGNIVASESCAGDLGSSIAPGMGKSIVWNAGADLNEYIGTLNFTLVMDDRFVSRMALIPGGTNGGVDPDFGDYSLSVSPFYMGATEVTKIMWDDVYQWALSNGYRFENTGYGTGSDYPVGLVNWYDCVRWCNALSEKEGKTPCYTKSGNIYRTILPLPDCNFDADGYRLPTREEWEYAARGGLVGKRFPWGDTISHSQANYDSSESYPYDISPTRGYHPDYEGRCPAGELEANGFGLYNMAGNVLEWTNDGDYNRYVNGGAYYLEANDARCRSYYVAGPTQTSKNIGFRFVSRTNTTEPAIQIVSGHALTTVDTRDYVLNVISQYGSPRPAAGPHLYAWKSSVTCSVESVFSEHGLSGPNAGWLGTGSIPASGSTNTTGRIVLTNLDSSIIWQWLPSLSFSTNAVLAGEMVQVPGGLVHGTDPDFGQYLFRVDTFDMDPVEVTNEEMIRVMQWAYEQGKILVNDTSVQNARGEPQELLDLDQPQCRITWDGSFFRAKSTKGEGYPCVEVTWFGALAYCNYRSEIDGLDPCYDLTDWTCIMDAAGYRLPTKAERECAARGGESGLRFSWGDTISHQNANFKGGYLSYDLTVKKYYHRDYRTGGYPYLNPVHDFPPNDYGLYDMAGNVHEWVMGANGESYFTGSASWSSLASYGRCGNFYDRGSGASGGNVGFRCCRAADLEVEAACPSNSLFELRWPTQRNRQYWVEYSDDLSTWYPAGSRMFGANGFLLETVDTSVSPHRYFRVGASTNFIIDVARFNNSIPGSKWTYGVTETTGGSVETYVETAEVVGEAVFNGMPAYMLRHEIEGVWSENEYVSTNFSQGLLELGYTDSDGETEVVTPHNLLFPTSFTPDVMVSGNMTSSLTGPVNSEHTVCVEADLITVPAGVFTNSIKVVTLLNGVRDGIAYNVLATEWYVLDIGMIKQVLEFNIPSYWVKDTTEMELLEFETPSAQ